MVFPAGRRPGAAPRDEIPVPAPAQICQRQMTIKEGAIMNAQGKLIGLVLVLLVSMLLVFVDSGQGAEWASVTDDRLLNADKDPNNWLMYYRTYNGWRYSPLSQVNRHTAASLCPGCRHWRAAVEV